MAPGERTETARPDGGPGRRTGAPASAARDGAGRAEPWAVGRAHHAALAAVVVGAAALRLAHLDQPIRYDEAVTYLRYVSRPLPEALAAYDLPNNHLFHTLLAHLSIEALGDTPAALRLPAWAAGTLVVPATYLLGRSLRGPGTGLLAAALAAGSPVLVLFSANARGYAIVVLAALAMAGATRVLARGRSAAAWWGFVAAAALGAWTIPAAVYPAAAAALWWAIAARGGRGAPRPGIVAAALAAAALAALLYLPVVRRWGVEAVVANRFVAPRALPEFAASVPGFLAEVGREWTRGVPAWASALVLAGAAVEGAAWASGRRSGAPPLFPVWALASVLVLAASRRVPFARVWLFLLPPLLIFAASGLGRVGAAVGRWAGPGRRRGVRLAAAALPAALGTALGAAVLRADAVPGWGLTGSLPSGERAAELVADRWRPGDGVLAELPSDAPLRYYLPRHGVPAESVGRRPEPGGCAFAVVNGRHGQTLSGVAGASPSGPPRVLGSWGETVVYGWPEGRRAGAAREEARCSARGGGASSGWRHRRAADTFAAIGFHGPPGPDGRGEREGSGRTTETPGPH